MYPKVVLSPFPLRPLNPSPFGWQQATPRLYKNLPSPPPSPFACPYLRNQTPSRIECYLKSVNSTTLIPPSASTSIFLLPLLPPFGLMDRPPSKTLLDSPRQPRRRGTTPSISETPHPSQPTPVPGSTSTPLPSIRHLHPNLPPPNQYLGHSDPPAYPSPSFDHPPQPGHVRYHPAHQDPGKELLPIEESDSDKHSSPPPKKRRKRQALSCTGQ